MSVSFHNSLPKSCFRGPSSCIINYCFAKEIVTGGGGGGRESQYVVFKLQRLECLHLENSKKTAGQGALEVTQIL